MNVAAVKCFASFLLFLYTFMDQYVAVNNTRPLDIFFQLLAVFTTFIKNSITVVYYIFSVIHNIDYQTCTAA
jgi:hypothetical protein